MGITLTGKPLEVATKWIEALESGEYQQGRALLHRSRSEHPDTYCCLGVCRALNPDEITGDVDDVYLEKTYLSVELGLHGKHTADDAIGEEVRGAFTDDGTDSYDVLKMNDEVQHALGLLNDRDDYSFMDIASVLRDFYGIHK